jgi:hypothetical protein
MPLAMTQRWILALLFPIALAAGAWQARREQRSKVDELFASTARPRVQRVLPTLGALALAMVAGYLLIVAATAPRFLDTAGYLPAAAFAVWAVGALALVTATWVGFAVGRLIPSLLTAPALAVAGLGLLLTIPRAAGDRPWLAMIFSPMHGMGQYTDYQTVAARTTTAQAIWLTALALAAVALLAAGSWRTRPAALAPAALGAAGAIMVIPHGAAFVEHPVDEVARAQVCDGDVCVSRIHEKLLPEVEGPARDALARLARLPGAPVRAQEDTSAYFGTPALPHEPGTVLMRLRVGANGHVDGLADLAPTMLFAGGADISKCDQGPDPTVGHAVAWWLLDRGPDNEPDYDKDFARDIREAAESLGALPDAEAVALATRIRDAAAACQDVTGMLGGSSG